MRTLTRLVVSTIATVALASASTAVANDSRKKKKKERESHATLIAAVSATSISIKQDTTEKTVAITPATEIYVRDKKAAIDALQTGMAVNITLSMDGASASRISATDAPILRDLPDRKSKSKKRR